MPRSWWARLWLLTLVATSAAVPATRVHTPHRRRLLDADKAFALFDFVNESLDDVTSKLSDLGGGEQRPSTEATEAISTLSSSATLSSSTTGATVSPDSQTSPPDIGVKLQQDDQASGTSSSPSTTQALSTSLASAGQTSGTISGSFASMTTAAVTVSQGIIVGARNATASIDKFVGIPFALPPTGTRRLSKPQTTTASYSGGTLAATNAPTGCVPFYVAPAATGVDTPSLGLFAASSNSTTIAYSEDCLTLTVWRPQVASTNQEPMPVLVYIFGGGFEFGSNNINDPSLLLQRSVALGKPMMLVAMNYRVGGYGFLAGEELREEGSTNLGLRDQRMALEWVADNIDKFGGDPNKVTIWGQSAGAMSVMDHTIINGGNNMYNGKALFVGAIMNSGSIVPAQNSDSEKAQRVFDQVKQTSGCDDLECLRALDAETFAAAVMSVPNIFGPESFNLAYLPRPDGDESGDDFLQTTPAQALANGNFARVPVLCNNVNNEGTLFALHPGQRNLTSQQAITDYLKVFFPSASTGLLDQLYEASIDTSGAVPDNYPGNKQLALLLGDATFTMMRRNYLALITNQGVRAWSYLDSHMSAANLSLSLGTFHGADMGEILTGGISPTMMADIQTRYISFVNEQDPNALLAASGSSAAPTWPAYTKESPQLLEYTSTGLSFRTDDFRTEISDLLAANVDVIRI